MTRTIKHNWTVVPEIGEQYEYCPQCGVTRNRRTGERISYGEALARATKQTESKNAKNS